MTRDGQLGIMRFHDFFNSFSIITVVERIGYTFMLI